MVTVKRIAYLFSILFIFTLIIINCPGLRNSDNVDWTIPENGFLDDFNDGLDPNLWGGTNLLFKTTYGIETAIYEYDAVNDINQNGFALKIFYYVPYNESFSGIEMKLNVGNEVRNLSEYKYLSFWVKSDQTGDPVKIEMKNSNSGIRNNAKLYIVDYLDGGITTNWQQVKIPLDAFSNLNSFDNLKSIVFVFEHDYAVYCGYPTTGTIYIDNIEFKKDSLGYVRIDHFPDQWGLNALGANIGDTGSASPTKGTHKHSYDGGNYHNFSYGLKSEYDVRFIQSWCGLFMIFGGAGIGDEDGYTPQPFDFSAYSMITLWVKSENADTTPDKIKIELKDNRPIPDPDNPPSFSRAYIPTDAENPVPISDTWTKYEVKFSNFTQDTGDPALNTRGIKQLTIVYEHDQISSDDQLGVVYFDEIQFEE